MGRPVLLASLLLLVSCSTARAQESPPPLVPAGTINQSVAHADQTYVLQDHDVVVKHAELVRRRFHGLAPAYIGDAALTEDLTGRNLMVYGTVDGHPWLTKYKERLPFQFSEGAVEIDGKRFEGEHLIVICAIQHPEDPDRRVAIYTAADVQDVHDINNRSHGPTAWLVADGKRTLGTGNFESMPFSSRQLLQDLAFLETKLRNVHPVMAGDQKSGDPNSKPRHDLPITTGLKVDAARKAFAKSQKLIDAWAMLAAVPASLGDGHSGLRPPESASVLELGFLWIGDQLVVDWVPDNADTEAQLAVGDVIVSLGGRTPLELLKDCRDLFGADNDGALRHIMSQHLVGQPLRSALGIEVDGAVVVKSRRGEEDRSTTVVPTSKPARRRGVSGSSRGEFFPEHDLAVLPIPKLTSKYTRERRFERFFEDVKKKGIGRVAIDVRGNPGGNSSFITTLCTHFYGVDVAGSYALRHQRISEESNEAGRTSGRLGLRKSLRPGSQRNEIVGVERFPKELFVLTSNSTFSSAAMLPVLARDMEWGKIIGQAPGTSPTHYGDLLMFTLPNTGLVLYLPFKLFIRRDSDNSERELTPDVVIEPTVQDLIDGRDPVIEYLKGLND